MRQSVWLFPSLTLVAVGLLLLAPSRPPTPGVIAKHMERYRPLSPEAASSQAVQRLETGFGLVFPHIGDGAVPSADQALRTALTLANGTDRPAEGFVEFYDDSGAPLTLTLNEETGSRFPFSMNGRETRRWVTSGTGPIQQGWAYVHADQALTGGLSFGIRNSAGDILTEVGVGESTPARRFTLFADSLGPSATGIAVANPSPSDALDVSFDLLDRSGVALATAERRLEPSGHLALFLDQLFPDTPGIADFEGSVVLSGEREFAGITLRSTGGVLTSMPMVRDPPEDAAWDQLAISHVGDGAGGGVAITTSVILLNNTAQSTEGVIDFFQSDGTPMEVTIGELTESSHAFQLPPRAVVRLVTGARGEIRSGWAEVSADQPLAGTALFSIVNASGRLITEVGVESTPLYKRFDIIADTLDEFNTGIALANPAPAGDPVTIEFNLLSHWGGFRGRVLQELGPREHAAFFLTDLFPDEPNIDEFEGRLRIFASDWLAPLCLRQAGLLLTSAPTLERRYGFAPFSGVEFSQQLAGSSPAMHWILSQQSGDYGVAKIGLSAPGIALRTEDLTEGERFGYGFEPDGYGSMTLDFVVTSLDGSDVEFDVVSSDREDRSVYAQGTLSSGSEGGFQLELQFVSADAPIVLPFDAQLRIHFPEGILVLPSSAGETALTTEFTSVPLGLDTEQRILRRGEASIRVNEPFPTAPNITSVQPHFLQGGRPAVVKGSNFGDDPVVLFETYAGRTTRVFPSSITDTELEVMVPDEILSDRRIRVETDQGRGWAYSTQTIFNPMLIMLQRGENGLEEGFGFLIIQFGEELLTSEFELMIFDANAALDQLTPGTVVGTVDQPWEYRGRQLVVRSAGPTDAQLDLQNSWDPDTTYGSLAVEKVDDQWRGLRLTFRQAEPPTGPNIQSNLNWQWILSGIELQFQEAGQRRGAFIRMISAPNGFGGREEGLEATGTAVFINP